MVKVAILGIGTVGGGTAEVLTKNRELIARRAGQEIELKYILCRKPGRTTPLRTSSCTTSTPSSTMTR